MVSTHLVSKLWPRPCHSKESTNLPKHSRKLFDRSFPCAWDGARRPGCAAECACGWTERCHPSFVFVLDNTTGSGRHGQLVDVGVCGMDFRVPVLVSLLLPVLLLTCLISVRRIMTDAVYSELKLFDRESRRMDDLCNKKLFKFFGQGNWQDFTYLLTCSAMVLVDVSFPLRTG